MKFKNYILIVGISLFVSCSTRIGDLSMPLPPTTRIFLNSISLPDSLSKAGIIKLFWSGESQNGYLRGFEITSDSNECSTDRNYRDALAWGFTTRTDSSFLFPIKRGQQLGKISFYARSLDNNNVKDPNPPCLRVPIRNSVPELKLKKEFNSRATTDTIHSVFTLSWAVNDADGDANLDSTFVKVNANGKWIGFSKSIEQLTFVPNNPDASDFTSAKLLGGLDGNDLKLNSGDIYINQRDSIFLRVKDISGSYSVPDTAYFYYKQKKSDFLYVDAYTGNAERSVYDPIISEAFNGTYDVFDMYRDNGNYFPKNWNLTFTKYLALYKRVFWVTDNAYSGGLSIENGATAIQTLLNNNGKIFISTNTLPDNRESPLYQFLPIDSVSLDALGSADINRSVNMIPQNGIADTLQSTSIISKIKTLYVAPAQQLYNASTINKNQLWSGPSTIAASGNDNAGKTNRILFSIDLHRLNNRPTQLKNFIKNILVNEFTK
ncbi:MAG: hypothetical protein ACKVOU_06315 [Cytophagales bacterium]